MIEEIKYRLIIIDIGTFEVRKIVWDLEKPNDILDIDVIMDDSVQSVKALFKGPLDWKQYVTLLRGD